MFFSYLYSEINLSNLVAKNNSYYVVLPDSIGQELGKATVGTAFLCPTKSGTRPEIYMAERRHWEPFPRWLLYHVSGAWAATATRVIKQSTSIRVILHMA